MASVRSRPSRFQGNDRERRDQGNKRLPQVETAGALDGGGFSNQRIRMSTMAELKDFAGRENNEERARNCISKVKSALLRDQAPDAQKYLVLSDLLTGPARDWYIQPSRSTRTSWKAILEGFMAKY